MSGLQPHIGPFIIRDPECEMCGMKNHGLRYNVTDVPKWICKTCSFINNPDSPIQIHPPHSDSPQQPSGSDGSSANSPGDGAAAGGGAGGASTSPASSSSGDPEEEMPWNCEACTFSNGPITLACLICGAARPHEKHPMIHHSRDPTTPDTIQDFLQESEDANPYTLPFQAPDLPDFSPAYVERLKNAWLQPWIEKGQLSVSGHVIQKFEEYLRADLNMQNLELPSREWIFKAPPQAVERVVGRIVKAQTVLKDIYTLHVKEEKLLARSPCQKCKRSKTQVFLLNPRRCPHLHCISCYRNHLETLIEAGKCLHVRCPTAGCPKELPLRIVRRVLNSETYERFEEQALKAALEEDPNVRIVNCPTAECRNVMSIAQPDQIQISEKITETDDMGQILDTDAWIHFNQHRIRCPECNQNFCANCGLQPYHKGFTCEGLQRHQEARKCRFCDAELPDLSEEEIRASAEDPFRDVCQDEECREKTAISCPAMLPCGHPCSGTKYHGKNRHICLWCEHEQQGGISPEELCAICFIEELQAAPVVRLGCRHIFHFDCVREKLERRWPGRRVTFGFAQCPTCKRMIHSGALKDVLGPVEEMYDDVLKRSLERLELEGLEKDRRLTDPNSSFFGKKEEFALSTFAYYPCFKCEKIYFGGKRDCEANADAERAPPDQFICYDCSEVKIIPCRKGHPKEFLEYKCRFCCSIATWYCWGSTRFCDRCHNQPNSGITYPCPGRHKCPLRIQHPPNSTQATSEFCLGCGICRQELTVGAEKR